MRLGLELYSTNSNEIHFRRANQTENNKRRAKACKEFVVN